MVPRLLAAARAMGSRTCADVIQPCSFFEVCYGAQAVSASASHEISHMRTRFSALSGAVR